MPDKEGAEEKTTKDVVTKRQKQLMNKEEYVQEMPDDVKNIMMKGLRKGAGEFSKGGDPKNIIKKGVKSTIKNVIKSKSVQNFLNNEYIPEEGYDVARDQGRVKPSKDKKDATTMPRSKEMEKTRKVNKGPSALERVKADIEKRYGKGAIMNVSKEELDLTQVAEAFGGYVIDENVFTKTGDVFAGLKKQFDRLRQGYGSQKDAKQIQKKIVTSQIPSSEKKGKKDPFNPSGPPAEFDDPNKARATVKIGKKTQIDQSQIGVAPGQKEAPVRTFKNQAELEAYKKSERLKKVDKKLQKDMMSRAEGPQKRGRKTTGSTYRKDLDSTIKVKKKLKSQPLVKGLEKAKTKVGTGFKTFRQTASSLPKAAKTATQNLAKTQAVKKVTSNLTKGGLKTATKTAGKKAAGLVAKRTIGRALGKGLAKQIPGIGTVISGGEAIARFATGDVVGGVLSAAEMIPGLGLAAGAANVARDIGRTRRAVKTIKKIKPLSKGMKLVQKSKTGRALSKMQRTARRNPLATVGGAAVGTGVGVDTATGMRKGKLPKVPRPKLDQGVVGRRTAG